MQAKLLGSWPFDLIPWLISMNILLEWPRVEIGWPEKWVGAEISTVKPLRVSWPHTTSRPLLVSAALESSK